MSKLVQFPVRNVIILFCIIFLLLFYPRQSPAPSRPEKKREIKEKGKQQQKPICFDPNQTHRVFQDHSLKEYYKESLLLTLEETGKKNSLMRALKDLSCYSTRIRCLTTRPRRRLSSESPIPPSISLLPPVFLFI